MGGIDTLMRAGLSLVVLCGFLFTLRIGPLMEWAADGYVSRGKTPNMRAQAHGNSTEPRSDSVGFLPRFPGASHVSGGTFAFNGVPCLLEEWSTSASGADVLGYCREQMLARGWEDITEETFNLNSEVLAAGDDTGMPSERLMAIYQAMNNSQLTLRRGYWTINLSVVEQGNRVGGTTVKLLAVNAPSFWSLSRHMSLELKGATEGGLFRDVNFVERNHGQKYHSVFVTKNTGEAQAFADVLTELGAKHWQAVAMTSRSQGDSAYVAWLVKGSAYAVLSVSSLPQGGSSIALIEVTPENSK
jgi:hypothetical protein